MTACLDSPACCLALLLVPPQLFPMIGQHPFMVLGAHMAVHPATGTCVAALVGSRDRTLARYSTRLLPQPAAMGAAPGPSAAPAGSSARSNGGSKAAGAVGLISGMAQAAKELLLSFYKVNQVCIAAAQHAEHTAAVQA